MYKLPYMFNFSNLKDTYKLGVERLAFFKIQEFGFMTDPEMDTEKEIKRIENEIKALMPYKMYSMYRNSLMKSSMFLWHSFPNHWLLKVIVYPFRSIC